jgi:hydrogenase maturation protease
MRVICCGNRERGDDGAAVLVAERLRDLGIEAQIHSGEALALMDAWDKADEVIVVDAMVTGAAAGTTQVWEAPLPAAFVDAPASTHGLGVGEAIKLAQVIGRLPERLRVYGIEGKHFGSGDEISSEVKQAAERVAEQIAAAAGR